MRHSALSGSGRGCGSEPRILEVGYADESVVFTGFGLRGLGFRCECVEVSFFGFWFSVLLFGIFGVWVLQGP